MSLKKQSKRENCSSILCNEGRDVGSYCNESKIMRSYVQSNFHISLIESNFKHETLHKYHYVLHQYIVHYSSIYKESVIQLVTELMCVIVTPSSNK